MDYQITALKAQKRNPNRVNVFLDGVYSFSLARIIAAWLKVGQTVDEEKIASLKKQVGEEKALQKALSFISYRPRSEKEIRNKLETSGYAPDLIDRVLERLRKAEVLDDEKFARDWVENRSIFRPRSKRLMAMELRHKGISEEIILNAISGSDDDEMLALAAARKRVHRLENLDREAFRKKLSEYLIRQGFNYGITAAVVSQVWSELETEETANLHK